MLKKIFKTFRSNVIKGNGNISINGNLYSSGRTSDVSIQGNKIYVNGKLASTKTNEKVVNIVIEGDCKGDINCNGSVEVKGNCEGNIDANGNVTIGQDCKGSIDANGRVYIGKTRY